MRGKGKRIITLLLCLICTVSIFTSNEYCKAKKAPTKEKKCKYDKNLCMKGESLLLSFKIKDSSKRVSVCIMNKKNDYIVFRYGTQKSIEIEYPKTKKKSWEKFKYSYYSRGGGPENAGIDLNELTFSDKKNTYTIYHNYCAEDEKFTFGLTIMNKKTKKTTEFQGKKDTLTGSLIDLRDSDKIEIGSL